MKRAKVEKPRAEKVPEKPANQEPKPEDQLDTLIGKVYLIRKTGVELLEGPDAIPKIKTIQEGTRDNPDGDMDYTFYEGGRPVYVAVENGTLSPLTFPDPGAKPEQMGMTSMKLYSLAVTLAQTIEKIIELETTPKPSVVDQAKKIMTPTIAIVACVFVIFLIVISMQ